MFPCEVTAPLCSSVTATIVSNNTTTASVAASSAIWHSIDVSIST